MKDQSPVKKTLLKKILIGIGTLFQDYLPNHIINRIPFYFIRHLYYRKAVGLTLSEGASIHLNTTIQGTNISIGKNTVINRKCNLDGRGKIFIGENCSISEAVYISTADHDPNSTDFKLRFHNVIINDYVFIGSRATVLGNIKIGKGAIICAGAIVTKDVEAFSIVAGIPAKKIGNRRSDLNYNPKWMGWFD